MASWLTAPVLFARSVVLGTLRPPADATSSQIRLNGAACVGVGLVLFVVAGALAFAAHRLAEHSPLVQKLAVGPILVAYVPIIVGGYRLLTGREPDDPGDSAWSSIRRIGLGVVAVVLAMVLLIVLLIAVGLLFELR